MQFYWRIMEELRFLGETLIFNDPGLRRQFRWWLRKNSLGLEMSAVDYTMRVDPGLSSLNGLRSLN